eukprot:gene16523-biopygen12200
MSNSYDNKYGTLNLLLHKNHYYTILDRNRFLHHRLKCYGCETTFSRLQSLARHMKNVCGKQTYCYACGSLQAHENAWAKAKRLFGISDALLSPEMQDEPLYWMRHYVTFDFEALLKSVKQSQLNSWDAEVGMDVEERLLDTTTTAPVDDDDDDDDTLVNIPLSYATATNFACCDNDDDDDDDNVFEKEVTRRKDDDDDDDEAMYCERDKTDKYFSLFRMARNPRRLVARFVADLMKMADCRRRQVRKEYAPVLAHVERWFEERGLTCRLQTTCQFSECVVAQSGGGDGKKEDVLMEIYKDEIATVRKLKRHLEYMPVIGFNSSGYDLPLIKKYLYDVCLHDYRVSRDDFHFIKKNSKYVSLTIKDELRSGGLVFLDTCNYLAAGAYSLDTFIKAFLVVGDDEDEDNARKSYFPYEYVNTYEKLSETHMPPYESFFSTLTQSNWLEDELQTWRLKNHCFFNDDDDDDDDDNRPASGCEKYRRLCEMWEEKGFRTLGDFLCDYNLKDVRPFLRSVENYALQLREKGVDKFRDGISLPGLAKAILSHTIPPNTFHYIDNAELYRRVYKSEVGGQSIIFKRINELPHVKGYDANALYLHSMCEPQYVGRPVVYRQVAGSVMVRTEMPPSSMRLTEERRLRDVALGVGAEGGPIRIDERRDSREARLFLDYLDRCVLTSRRVVLQRQKYLRLCRSEIDLLQGKYAELFGSGDELRRAPHFFVVDGMFVDYEHDQTDDDDQRCRRRRREQRCVVEFEGCYWHACMREESKCRERVADKTYTRNGRRMTAAQVRAMDEARRTVLRQRGYRVIMMKECIWQERCRRHDDLVPAFVEERRREREDDPLERCADWVGYTTQETLIDALLQRKVFGLITCDVHVPEECREYFREFAPIIKHAYVNYANVGEFTQTVADENGITIKNRKCVIDSYISRRITITDEYFVWLLEHDVECTRVYDFIRYDKQPIFAEFGRDITRLRVQGNRDKSSEMKTNTAKLVGNSAFGSASLQGQTPRRTTRVLARTARQSDGENAHADERSTVGEQTDETRDRLHEHVCALRTGLCAGAGGGVEEATHSVRSTALHQQNDLRSGQAVRTHVRVRFFETSTETRSFRTARNRYGQHLFGHERRSFRRQRGRGQTREYERLKHDYFVTEKCEFGKRQPNR